MDVKLTTYIKKEYFCKDKYNQFVLAGDVGATNTRLQVSGMTADESEPLYKMNYPSGSLEEFKNHVIETLSLAKNNYGIDKIEKGAFGVPGRISRDRQTCTITFLDWGEEIPLVSIIKSLGIKRVYLLNDLEAGAHGVMSVDKENLVKISSPDTSLPQKDNYRLILGMPGTGFGNGYRNENGLTRSTEGGGRAVAISPASMIEHDLLTCIYQEINKNNLPDEEEILPTYDYVISGPGIRRIKDTLLRQEKYADYSQEIINKINTIPQEDQPIIITNLATGKDPLCKGGIGDDLCIEVIEIFCKFFARSLQGIALFALPEAVFLGGNIVNAIQQLIRRLFIKYFTKHVSHENYLKKFPVYIINNEENLNLKGATYAAIFLAD